MIVPFQYTCSFTDSYLTSHLFSYLVSHLVSYSVRHCSTYLKIKHVRENISQVSYGMLFAYFVSHLFSYTVSHFSSEIVLHSWKQRVSHYSVSALNTLLDKTDKFVEMSARLLKNIFLLLMNIVDLYLPSLETQGIFWKKKKNCLKNNKF